LSGDLPITHKLITSQDDILSLDIINWGPSAIRGFRNVNDAVGSIASWFINTSHYTTVSVDITKAPSRGDFPGWGHKGDHPRIGELYWNWFHTHYDGELYFSDSPDFRGVIRDGGEKPIRFFGDIGQVTAVCMAYTQKRLSFGNIWISVVDEQNQVIIEPFVSLIQEFGAQMFSMIEGKSPENSSKIVAVNKPIQLELF